MEFLDSDPSVPSGNEKIPRDKTPGGQRRFMSIFAALMKGGSGRPRSPSTHSLVSGTPPETLVGKNLGVNANTAKI
jgi:hypothetical protein